MSNTETGLTNARRYQHCWCLFVEVSRKIKASVSLQIHGECKVSHTVFPFFALGVNPSPYLFVSSSSPTLSVVFLVAERIPRRNPLDEWLAKNSIGFKKLISRGRLLVGVSHLAPCSRMKVNLRKVKKNHDDRKGSKERMGRRTNG